MAGNAPSHRGAHLKQYHFPKGASANPGGKPKAAMVVAKLIREKTNDCADLVDVIHRVAMGQEPGLDDAKSRRWAFDWLSDRAMGKAPVVIETGEQREAPLKGKLTTEELRSLDATLSKLQGAPPFGMSSGDDDPEAEDSDEEPAPTEPIHVDRGAGSN